MSNVQKFFNKNCLVANEDEKDDNVFFQSEEMDAIEIKLIKLKSQGLISSYHYNYYNALWDVKGNNGVSCECRLNENAECFNNVSFFYKTQSVDKYFSNSMTLADAFGSVYEELEEMYQLELEEEREKEKQYNEEPATIGIDFGSIETTAVA